ncbi:MAG: translation initiation factor IF-2 [Bacteroidetes bacterium GWC2_33_15]|nr:MAG: translation initiation factor IF-2 [Bacteroidetes bacterium GWA2_33_15]OFX51994.1 MAG: translation initiation factor IF-2 [Bacteroidetes bacterium GWC2_33_15]OFX63824.1 MAG: translation initiation factor IF-2 [Bacteroidetes bacterium GWB2_32_14]OFX67397.1 MAG: translation initiation factor IF-2 [Bacteroidetes bacterium GWD2_33_33]HAN17840.1 translation initiation factor IF-2 [Bacteroidales bacterium]
MGQDKTTRLSKVAREFNVGISTIIEFLHKKGHELDSNPNTKVPEELYNILVKEYSSDFNAKKESEKLILAKLREKKETISINDIPHHPANDEETDDDSSNRDEEIMIKDFSSRNSGTLPETKPVQDSIKIVGKIDLDKKQKKEEPEKEQEPKVVQETIKKEKNPEEVKPTEEDKKTEQGKDTVKVVGRIDLDSLNQKTRPDKKTKKQREQEQEDLKQKNTITKHHPKTEEKTEDSKPEEKVEEKIIKQDLEPPRVVFKSEVQKLTGPTVVGKIDLPVASKDKDKKPVASSNDLRSKKKKRKRIHKDFKDKVEVVLKKPAEVEADKKKEHESFNKLKKKKKRQLRPEISEVDVQKQIKDTLARLTTKGKSKGSKHRRDKRDAFSLKQQEDSIKLEADKQILKVTEFVSVNELASMMSVPVNEVISVCMNLGLLVSINQRLNAETMALVADEFNFKVQFISVEVQEAIKEEEDTEEELVYRPPIVTVMGHVDHGKTSLLDFIRKANVIAGEAGGITQHIGAYSVILDNGKTITFLDTPGHEAFTAMRARGAQVTDVVIIVVSADDNVMPQTVEAINHASAAGVPIIFAINKIDKTGANPEKIKEELANMNYLVEEWGGKYQSQDISAKQGTNVDLLLEKVLLEAELLDLKANPDKKAHGTVIESELDKGRGYISTILVESGTLKIGDVILAGSYFGHAKAMYNERGKRIDTAGPSTPVQILGLNGAPQAGDKFNVMESDKEAREIANKREQLQREQSLRTQKHITLDEIGRRIAIGNFQEINIVVKGDVDGSIEALSDSLIKLGTDEIQVNIIHKGVGQISESDVLLAAASNAIIIGFQVRPSMNARKLAEKEEIDIRLYSIIYDAINEVHDAMEGMLSPEIKEEIVATVEVREVFKIKKVGSVAGCMVKEGKINRNTSIRVIRDGIVIYSGQLGSLKRFKDDVKEVVSGYECGLNVDNYNDIKVGDIIEGYQQVEVKKKL